VVTQIARKGHYGAFLLDDPALVTRILSSMVRGLKAPVTAKIRLLPTEQDTLDLVRRIEDTGCQMLAGACGSDAWLKPSVPYCRARGRVSQSLEGCLSRVDMGSTW
jgi:hypothetical protein